MGLFYGIITLMNAQKIRSKYLEFYKKQGHAVVERAPLILTNDPTTLFTGARMQPMIPYLLGEAHPKVRELLILKRVCERRTSTTLAIIVIQRFLRCLETGVWAIILRKSKLAGCGRF